jgi:hypothetical protein
VCCATAQPGLPEYIPEMTFGLNRCLLAALALTVGLVALPVWSQGIALVTDVSGKVTGPVPISILSEISADAQIQLEPGARLVALYIKSGDEYTLSGPAQVRFQAAGPHVLSGAKPQKRASPIGKGGNVSINPARVTQAAYVMRSGRATARIKLLTLSATKALDTSPEFRWQSAEQGLNYRFELTDDTGRSLYETEVQTTSLKLPGSVALKEGASYTWEVSARTPDNRRYISAGDFTIAPAGLRAQAESLRPAASAPVSDRVAYAAWLEQAELHDEARRYWRALYKERPDDEKLKALAAE